MKNLISVLITLVPTLTFAAANAEFTKGIDLTGVSSVSGSQLNQLVDNAKPAAARGLVFSGTVQPNVTNYPYMTNYLYRDTSVSPPALKFYDGTNWTTATVTANTITTTSITNGAITVDKLADDAVETAKIKDNAVDNSKLANNSVNTANIIDGSVTRPKILDGAIDATKITNNTITASLMAVDSIRGSNIVNGTITADKMAAGVLSGGSIADNSITAAKLMVNSVANTNIQINAIATTNVQDNSITDTKIATDAIRATNIVDGSITAAKLSFSGYTPLGFSKFSLDGSGNLVDAKTWTNGITVGCTNSILFVTFALRGNTNICWNFNGKADGYVLGLREEANTVSNITFTVQKFQVNVWTDGASIASTNNLTVYGF